MIINFNDINKDKSYQLYDGYIRGNMFKDLYEPYNNHSFYNIKPKSKKEECLLELMMLSFAINDLNLYLIINSDDKEIFNKYKYYINTYQKKMMEYENTYGMLNLDNEKDNFTYLEIPLPWEVNNV